MGESNAQDVFTLRYWAAIDAVTEGRHSTEDTLMLLLQELLGNTEEFFKACDANGIRQYKENPMGPPWGPVCRLCGEWRRVQDWPSIDQGTLRVPSSYFTPFKKFAFAEIYRVLSAGKFSVKAQPYWWMINGIFLSLFSMRFHPAVCVTDIG
jgi:hypothetical protein